VKFVQILVLSACVHLSSCQSIGTKTSVHTVMEKTVSTFETKTSELVDKLTKNSRYDFKNNSSLITTFVWSDTLTYKEMNHPLKNLGYQLAESIKVQLVQKEALVLEHKSARFIAIDKKATYFLSRETDDLNKTINAHYIVAGTLTEVEGGASVYAEVIEFSSGIIVSSGQEFIPSSLFWSDTQITSHDGKLFRQSQSR
jgi:hypothetical protein